MSIPYAEVALQRCSHEKTPRKIRNKSTGEQPHRSATPTKPPCSFSHTPTRPLPHKSTPQIPKNTLPQEHPKGTASAYIQKSKLIRNNKNNLFQKYRTSSSVSSSFDLTFLENKW